MDNDGNITTSLLSQRNIFPHDTAIEKLYSEAVENSYLTFTDYLTIGDLSQISGYNDYGFHLLMLTLYGSLYMGNTCVILTREHLEPLHLALFNQYNDNDLELLKNALSLYSRLVTSEENRGETVYPILFDDSEKDKIAFHRYYFLEKELHELISRHASKEGMILPPDEAGKILKDVMIKASIFPQVPSPPDTYQGVALLIPFISPITIISGGPGTGKSSLIVNSIRMMLRAGIEPENIAVAAPTGRAASRLHNALESGYHSLKEPDLYDSMLQQIEPLTVHRLLHFSTKKGFQKNQYAPLQKKVIIVDEVSMIDLELMHAFFLAVREDAHIILVGDKNQLPPVKAGSIIHDLIPETDRPIFLQKQFQYLENSIKSISIEPPVCHESKNNIAIALLEKNYRSIKEIIVISKGITHGEKSITSLLHNIPHGETTAVTIKNTERTVLRPLLSAELPPASFIEVTEESLSLHRLTLETWILRRFTEKSFITRLNEFMETEKEILLAEKQDLIEEVYNAMTSSVILSPVKKTREGTEYINSIANSLYFSLFNRVSGTPVIVTTNNYQLNLNNGDLGIRHISKDNRETLFFNDHGTFRAVPSELLPHHDSAFALTVHKSQGSEFEEVALSIPSDNEESFFTKEMFYTAVTRAKKKVLLIGSQKSIDRVSHRTSLRMSLFSQ